MKRPAQRLVPVDQPRHPRLRLRLAVSAITVAVAAMLIAPSSAAANDDPHRIFWESAPYDLPAGVCDFPVHLAFPVDREYAHVSELADGSTVFVVTGSWVVAVTNLETDETKELNVGGPARSSFRRTSRR